MTAELNQEEQERHDWRVEQFEELGFDAAQVVKLDGAGADWHQADALLRRGCPHDLVVRLLT